MTTFGTLAQLKMARLHFMGIGGSGISAVAQMPMQGGATVSGCDAGESESTRMLEGLCAISVSGLHGKGTTTSMLALILVDAGLDPTCEIGAIVPRFGVNYRIGESAYFVNEADEFNNNFWHYHPRLAVVTSIEFEHPEFFRDYEEYLASFEHFIRGMDMQGDWPF